MIIFHSTKKILICAICVICGYCFYAFNIRTIRVILGSLLLFSGYGLYFRRQIPELPIVYLNTIVQVQSVSLVRIVPWFFLKFPEFRSGTIPGNLRQWTTSSSIHLFKIKAYFHGRPCSPLPFFPTSPFSLTCQLPTLPGSNRHVNSYSPVPYFYWPSSRRDIHLIIACPSHYTF